MELKKLGVPAGGAALALILGLGAGFVGRAPIDRALTLHPMDSGPGDVPNRLHRAAGDWRIPAAARRAGQGGGAW